MYRAIRDGEAPDLPVCTGRQSRHPAPVAARHPHRVIDTDKGRSARSARLRRSWPRTGRRPAAPGPTRARPTPARPEHAPPRADPSTPHPEPTRARPARAAAQRPASPGRSKPAPRWSGRQLHREPASFPLCTGEPSRPMCPRHGGPGTRLRAGAGRTPRPATTLAARRTTRPVLPLGILRSRAGASIGPEVGEPRAGELCPDALASGAWPCDGSNDSGSARSGPGPGRSTRSGAGLRRSPRSGQRPGRAPEPRRKP